MVRITSRDYYNLVSFLNCKLQCETVFNIHTAYLFTGIHQVQVAVGEYTVYVKSKNFNLG